MKIRKFKSLLAFLLILIASNMFWGRDIEMTPISFLFYLGAQNRLLILLW